MRTPEHERSFIGKPYGKYTNNRAGNVLGLMYSYHKPFHFEQQVVDPDIHFNYIKAAAKTGQIKV